MREVPTAPDPLSALAARPPLLPPPATDHPPSPTPLNRLVHLTAVILVASACTDTPDPASGAAAVPSTRASLTAELRIDGTEHDLVPFGGVAGGSIAVAGDGTVAISQMQDHLVRFFSGEGAYLGSFGGEGRGPGEFVRNARMGWLADSLWVYDPGQERVTVLMPSRGLARTIGVGGGAKPSSALKETVPGSPYAYPVALHPGGAFTSLVLPLWDQSPAAYVDHVFFASVSAEAEITRVVAMIPSGDTHARDNRGGSASLPFANRTVEDVARDGRHVGFARARTDGASASVAVSLFRSDGDTVFVTHVPIDLVPLPASVRDSVFERRISSLQSMSPSLADALRERSGEATHHPPLQDMIIGRDGTTWISLANRDGERPYLVLDPDGAPLGRVHVSDRSRIAEAERDRIWVIEKDEFDVESLVRYAVEW